MSSPAGPAFILGGLGQLGRELAGTAPRGREVVTLDLPDFDLTDRSAIEREFDRHRPSLVVNAAAYTAVDRAETDADRAHQLNAVAPGALAEAAARRGIQLIHISTDFVFSGAQGHPYEPEDAPAPLGVYGQTKLDGERQVLGAYPQATVVRTAWLYSRFGSNFVLTMLKLLGTRPRVTVVADQVGAPTWARSLARALWAFDGRSDVGGIWHWTDAGVASWFDFAVAIREEALQLGLLSSPGPVEPIRSAEYPSAARRPAFSVLACERTRSTIALPAVHWRVHLREMLTELGHG